MFVSIITIYFLVYMFVDFYEAEYFLHTQKFSRQLTESFHVMYNTKLDDKCEIELKELCQNNYHMFLGQ